MDFKGKEYSHDTFDYQFGNFTDQLILQFPKSDFLVKNKSNNELLLLATWKGEHQQVSSTFYFTKPKELKLSQPRIDLKLVNDSTLEITSNVLAKDVYLSLPGEELTLSNNFIDLMPNQKTRIQLNKGNIDPTRIKVKTLYDIQNAQKK
jgi:beta-mannosidase